MNKNSLFEKLDSDMVDGFNCINLKNNPFIKNIHKLSKEGQIKFLFQYSHFPKNIISFLVDSTYILSYYGFHNIVRNLVVNIREELGEVKEISCSNNINTPHYSFLRKSILSSLNIDILLSTPSISTALFLQGIKRSVNKDNPFYVAGSVYALESSAINELKIVRQILGKNLNKNSFSQGLNKFFSGHIENIEVGHKKDFQSSCCEYLKGEYVSDFESGFFSIIRSMEIWWNSLKLEILL